MIQIIETERFSAWLSNLRDRRARGYIQVRLDRLRRGNPGDVKPVGKGISEMRIDYGSGYRLYYLRRGEAVVVLLCGGDKRTQAQDVKRALQIAKEL